MSNLDQFKTGDLCVAKTLGKFASFIRFLTISEYNHVCVAIRIDPTVLPRIKVVRTGGKLLFLEKSKNPETGNIERVIRVNVMNNINLIRLPLKDEFYSAEFENRIEQLIYLTAFKLELVIGEYQKIQKPQNYRYTINPEARSQLIPVIKNVCSENSADFYHITLPDNYDKTIIPAVVFVPQTFLGAKGNPYYKLFDNSQMLFQNDIPNYYWLDLIILVIIIIILIVLCYFGFRFLYRRYYK